MHQHSEANRVTELPSYRMTREKKCMLKIIIIITMWAQFQWAYIPRICSFHNATNIKWNPMTTTCEKYANNTAQRGKAQWLKLIYKQRQGWKTENQISNETNQCFEKQMKNEHESDRWAIRVHECVSQYCKYSTHIMSTLGSHALLAIVTRSSHFLHYVERIRFCEMSLSQFRSHKRETKTTNNSTKISWNFPNFGIN